MIIAVMYQKLITVKNVVILTILKVAHITQTARTLTDLQTVFKVWVWSL